jgi:hypothetical protein
MRLTETYTHYGQYLAPTRNIASGHEGEEDEVR